jgi:hypothetical protein
LFYCFSLFLSLSLVLSFFHFDLLLFFSFIHDIVSIQCLDHKSYSSLDVFFRGVFFWSF